MTDKLARWLQDITSNWKVVVAGVGLVAATFAFFLDKITWDHYVEILGSLTGVGFIASASNLSRPQNSNPPQIPQIGGQANAKVPGETPKS